MEEEIAKAPERTYLKWMGLWWLLSVYPMVFLLLRCSMPCEWLEKAKDV
jgi:hypothetical protein